MSATTSSVSAVGMLLISRSHPREPVLKLRWTAARTTSRQDSAVHEEDEGDGSDEEDDQPELFSVVDQDEDNDIRTELYSHPSVKKAMRTLSQQANFRGVSAPRPKATTTARGDADIEPKAVQGFIFPSEGKTAFPEVNMGGLRIAFASTLKRPIESWQELEDKSRVCGSRVLYHGSQTPTPFSFYRSALSGSATSVKNVHCPNGMSRLLDLRPNIVRNL